MAAALCAILFVSGAAALLFETLWFYQAGIAFGTSISASSLVLAAFMGGLALGSALAGRLGHRLRRPIRAYAALELAIGASGLALVLALPALAPLLARVIGPLIELPAALNTLRFASAFGLLLVPATAMGATLPLAVGALHRRDPRFGNVLGRLYGWNTLGAVLGALAGEALLFERFGIRTTAVLAAAASAAAAAGALVVSRRLEAEGSAATAPRPRAALPPAAWGILAGAFASGFALLALEVVWLRIALLHVRADALCFAIILAVVLAGIALGGLLGAHVLRLRPDAARLAPALALATGALVVATYAALGEIGPASGPWGRAARLALALMFPVALASGALFTFLGEALEHRAPAGTRSAGLLAFANTVGAMLGPLAAGFVLLPRAGMEVSLLGLASVYGLAALAPWLVGVRPRDLVGALLFGLCGASFALAIALFPTGAMRERHLDAPLRYWGRVDGPLDVVGIREGPAETLIYLERRLFDQPLYQRMLTNGVSMSGTNFAARRYMKLFAWWALAVNPDARKALLLGYGVGNTASALVDTRTLDSIDVVDISRDALETSRILYPDPTRFPLADPRVRVHVEDGRHFLQTTRERFDLITGEPPPPKIAGVVGLYTREQFELVRDRLAPGGVATWWLPVHGLAETDAKAILAAFCAAFPDCSLWRGARLDWMLVGTRDATGPGTRERFARQWTDPAVAPEMLSVGIETPAQLGALFIADASDLREIVGATPPLDDDHPKRLGREIVNARRSGEIYTPWLDIDRSRERFARSRLIDGLWPASLREESLAAFEVQREIDRVLAQKPEDPVARLPEIDALLAETRLRALPFWLLGGHPDVYRAARAAEAKGIADPAIEYVLGLAALSDRDFAVAARRFSRALELGQPARPARQLRIYALCMAGRTRAARVLAERLARSPRLDASDRAMLDFLGRRFGIETVRGR